MTILGNKHWHNRQPLLTADHAITGTFTKIGNKIECPGFNAIAVFLNLEKGDMAADIEFQWLIGARVEPAAPQAIEMKYAADQETRTPRIHKEPIFADPEQLVYFEMLLGNRIGSVQLQVRSAGSTTGLVLAQDSYYVLGY